MSDATNGSFLLKGLDLQRDPLCKTYSSLLYASSALLAAQNRAGFLSFRNKRHCGAPVAGLEQG